MTAAIDPARARQQIAEARRPAEWPADDGGVETASSDYTDGWNDALADRARPLADQLEAALAEIERLRALAGVG